MKEARLRSLICFYGSMIMSNTSTGKFLPWAWVGLSIFWAISYILLSTKNKTK
tara:strand:+ start:26 stop:184 length:159 start_codon:yes stop_codon:yes gene_type:complete